MPRDRDRHGSRRAGWLAGVGAVLVAARRSGSRSARSRCRPVGVAAELLNLLPGVDIHSGLTEREIAIVTELRLPRVVLGLLVGAMLALAGGCYQGVFRNPLADPYLLGVAAGAGLGATAAIALGARRPAALPACRSACRWPRSPARWSRSRSPTLLGAAGGRDRTPATLILAGVAVSRFLAADADLPPAAQRRRPSARCTPGCSAGWPPTAGTRCCCCCRTRWSPRVVVLAHAARARRALASATTEAASLGPAPAARPG